MSPEAILSEKPDIVLVENHDTRIDAEKQSQVKVIDSLSVWGLGAEDEAFYNSSMTAEQREKLKHKVDIRLIPMLAILYLVSHLDRANIGNAKIEGLVHDLKLKNTEYNIIPSNMVLNKLKRPSIYIGALVTAPGIVMTLHGVVNNFAGLLAVRLLLGVFESGFYPAAIYLCTCWYMPNDLATRIPYFYSTSALSGAFSGLLAAGITKMDGLGGYEGWRWIFILEGLFTIVLGFSCFFLLVDSPGWLTDNEIRFIELQNFIKSGGGIPEQTAGNNKKIDWYNVKKIFANWQIYLQSYILLCMAACSFGIKFTLPSITKNMGFTNTNAQLMTAPAYVAGAISAIIFARLSDRFRWRMPFVAIPLSFIIIGFAIVMGLQGNLAGRHLGPGYFAVVLACMGIYPIQPAGLSWSSNNLSPASRRAIGVGFNVAIGNIGGIIAGYMYLESEAPRYQTGYGLSLAFGASGLICAMVLEISYVWSNKQREKISEEEIRSRYTEQELLKLGDKSPRFKYIL
ncbi:hypothetical protein LCI18_014112 [Fusarium solani-melongenae]|uniref:Uncharacterized protein n=1 Tax=Fusarium solani subsp. cucurbitae TaxID=2747967 RepID=A0ACD3ZPX9_FUSSC|nr:hypothetical protein LCI18_014112 [Fusarium solani-melongenae]